MYARLSMIPVSLLAASCAVAQTQQERIQHGDVLLIERIQRTAQVDRPRNGMSMAAVEARYGRPEQRLGPVGQPPITRWVYPDFTVHFEHDRVITAVVNRASELEIGPRRHGE